MSEVVDLLDHTRPAPEDNRFRARPRDPILVAVDLGEDSRAAVVWASEMAEMTRAPMHILHVIHDPPESPGRYERNKSDPLEPIIDAAERMLADFMAELRADQPSLKGLAAADTTLARGLPAQTIVSEAQEIGASLIVVGCRGKGGLARLVYGSNAQRVTQLSPIPVTVVKGAAR